MHTLNKTNISSLKNLCNFFLSAGLLVSVQVSSSSQSLPVNVTLNSGYDPANNDIEAVESIVILPNFHVPVGSTFRARIKPRNEYLPTDPQDVNFLRTETVLTGGVTNDAAIDGLKVEQKSLGFQYFDGLGRLVQSIGVKQSPAFEDIIAPIHYDKFGRQKKQYLPYIGDIPDGTFRTNALTEQDAYYNPVTFGSFHNGVRTDADPFSEKDFEASPQNRVLQEAAPGAAWQLNARSVKYDNLVNKDGIGAGEERIIQWSILGGLPDNSQYYTSGMLLVNVTTDEDGHEVREYIDKRGRVVLKKVQEAPIAQINNDSHYTITYYIYNDIGDLAFVIPPEAVDRLAAEYSGQSTLNKQNFLNRWAFQYQYDGLRRMVEKRIPGAERLYMIYDRRDRLVLTQDGNQRDPSKTSGREWTFTKYDALDRMIMTGIYTHGSVVDRVAMQTIVNSENDQYETYNGNTGNYGYSNILFPTTGINVQAITFYDHYDFITDLGWSGYNTTVTGALNPARSQVTGFLTKVLGTSIYLKNATYYDNKYRVLQTITENHLGGKDVVSNTYDFPGRLLTTSRVHSSSTGNVTVLEEYTYDHASRVTKIHHTLDNGPRVLMVSNAYNELGELIEKNLHSTNNGSGFLQSVDYRYNIRGWLTHINNSMLSNDGTFNNDANDLFGTQLSYNDPAININGANTTPVFNGNIAAIRWKSNNLEDAPTERIYGYTYDPANRIVSARYAANAGGTWTAEAGNFDVDIPGYDKNGNIKRLTRYGDWGGRSMIDDLTYTYSNGNQLQKVDDNRDPQKGFVDGYTLTDYSYDHNGNLEYDLNKSVVDIQYNHLNLPVSVIRNKTGNPGHDEEIIYTYDASGIKLSQVVKDKNGIQVSRTDYVNGIQYQDDALAFVTTREGRALPYNGSYEYEYFLKDHLGNTRLTFGHLHESEAFVATMEDSEATREENEFENIASTRFTGYNHTPVSPSIISPVRSAWLNGSMPGREVGPAKSLAVTQGDKVTVEVYTRYEPASGNTSDVVATMVGLLTTSFGLTPTGETAAAYNAFNDPANFGFFNTISNASKPTAYINYILFDANYLNPQAGYIPITNQSASGFERLEMEIPVPVNGYIYIYTSNESNYDVYFDDLQILHEKTTGSLQVTQAQDYYPFGLAFNSYQQVAGNENKFKYSGMEEVTDLDMTLYDSEFRMYQPETGRWFSIDPLASYEPSWTPYRYSFNNPIRYNDPNGLLEIDQIIKIFNSAPSGKSAYNSLGECTCGCDDKPPCPEESQKALQNAPGLIIAIRTGEEILEKNAPKAIGFFGKFLGLFTGFMLSSHDAGNLGATKWSRQEQEKLNELLEKESMGILSTEDRHELLWLVERYEKAFGIDATYENPGHHDPKSGPNNYNPNKSVLPEDHINLWKNSVLASDGNRWTKVGTGKKAVYHRFQNDGNGNWHWNGSTDGRTKSGKVRAIKINNVPIEIQRR